MQYNTLASQLDQQWVSVKSWNKQLEARFFFCSCITCYDAQYDHYMQSRGCLQTLRWEDRSFMLFTVVKINARNQRKKSNVVFISCASAYNKKLVFLKFCQVLTNRNCLEEARVVRNMDSAIHRINHYPLDSVVCFVNIYLLESDLSGG